MNMKTTRGFTLLLAVIISSILIALGSAIFNIVAKEVLLSSSGRESQFAFFAADTGIECGLYWDLRQNAFGTTSPLTEVTCGGGPATLTRTPGGTALRPTLTTTFSFPIDGGIANPCVTMSVVKTFYPSETSMVSRGYNTCVTTNPLRLERAIRVQY
jgi:hypothetical protein